MVTSFNHYASIRWFDLSAMQAVEAVRREGGGHVPIVVTVVDRLEGAEENFEKEGIRLISILTREDFED